MADTTLIADRKLFLKAPQQKSFGNIREGRLIANLNQPWGALSDVNP
jgi:hypothetical protein